MHIVLFIKERGTSFSFRQSHPERENPKHSKSQKLDEVDDWKLIPGTFKNIHVHNLILFHWLEKLRRVERNAFSNKHQ